MNKNIFLSYYSTLTVHDIMTEEAKVVNVKELEKVQKNIDNIIKKSKSLPSFREILISDNETDLDERDKELFNYIRKNPEIIKQAVIDAFHGIPGYSRKPVLKRINRLRELGMIIVRPDKANSQTHHLSANYENELARLTVDLDSFKHRYFNLIVKVDALVNDRCIIHSGFLGLIENCKLVNAVLTPLKIILNLYNTFELFLPHRDLLDSESLHRKFTLIRNTINEVQSRLHSSVLKEPLVECDRYFTNTFLYNNLDISTNLLNSAMWGISFKNLKSMLVTFEQYGLSGDAEIVLDSLWKLVYPIFFNIYSDYGKENPNELNDWRQVIRNLSDNDTPTQAFHY